MRHGNLFVVSGPSGTGKGTLVAQVLKALPDSWLSISATTRAPREGERDGESYYFIGKEEFEKLIEDHGMLEWAEYNGNFYGTPRHSVLEHVNAGEQVFLEIDVQGALQVHNQIPGARLVFIEPPSLEELERRLRARGTDSEEAISNRLLIAQEELKQKDAYDICIVNDDLDEAAARLIAFVEDVFEE